MPVPQTADGYLDAAGAKIAGLEGHVLDVLSIRKPLDAGEALGWAKVVSKLSPILGNLSNPGSGPVVKPSSE